MANKLNELERTAPGVGVRISKFNQAKKIEKINPKKIFFAKSLFSENPLLNYSLCIRARLRSKFARSFVILKILKSHLPCAAFFPRRAKFPRQLRGVKFFISPYAPCTFCSFELWFGRFTLFSIFFSSFSFIQLSICRHVKNSYHFLSRVTGDDYEFIL